jgi:signal transduction histidine kinase
VEQQPAPTLKPEGGGPPLTKRSPLPFQKRKQLEQDIEHITAEMYRRNKQLADTNRTLTLLRTIDAMVLESHASLKQVCEHITEAISQATQYPFIGLFTRTPRSDRQLALYGWSGKDMVGGPDSLGLGRPLHLTLDHPWFAELEGARLISLEGLSHKYIAGFMGITETEVTAIMKQIPIKSLYIIKLRVRRRLVGVLVVGFTDPAEQLSDAETLVMDRMSETIGVALDNKLLFEENQHVLKQLRESNTKLRALDEAKDDFISMASHQLRTPLTSIKGYISMVMEGDAGKITPQQHTMLNQALVSSQRMVYMISDLLNVSRLRTGKFLIEPTPTNLAQVISEEIGQLKEMASLRGVTIRYKAVKKFPELMLDETKTRQIIMNLIDNAIYYTPGGGKIDVSLANTADTVEFRVKDTGIGVPRSEQKHLFTKFYRAGNARKARPDGTGLGLFMAKKVTIAQGGAIIFESKEGKGSTFGFMFSKAKLPPLTPAKPTPKSAANPVKKRKQVAKKA